MQKTTDLDQGKVNMPAAALSCCDYMKRNPPPLMYMKDFDRITKHQLSLVEHYRVAQATHCKLGRNSMGLMLEANKAFATRLGNLDPESWQTGLEDCGDFYTHRWKELIRYRLGHNDHDRTSVREYNTRFTLPMELRYLEGLTPMGYCVKYCIISNNRQTLYIRTHGRMRENRRPRINLNALADAISGLLGGTLEADQAAQLFELLELKENSRALAMEEFCIVCALAERFYYQKNLRSLTEETQQMQRGLLEAADFYRLSKRLETVKVQKPLLQLLERLMEAAEEAYAKAYPPATRPSQDTGISDWGPHSLGELSTEDI